MEMEMREARTKEEFLELLKNRGSDSYDEWFYSIANSLMNYFCLTVGKNEYRITECEIYFWNEEHKDLFIHMKEQQQTIGQLFLNDAGGLDLTFGNEKTYAGILIRGIRNLKTDMRINKIQKIVSLIFDSIGNIISDESGISLREYKSNQIKIEKPIQTTRVNLNKEKKGGEKFIDKPYRYIVEIVKGHEFGDHFKVIKKLLSENIISAEVSKSILGYKIKKQ